MRWMRGMHEPSLDGLAHRDLQLSADVSDRDWLRVCRATQAARGIVGGSELQPRHRKPMHGTGSEA